MLGRSLSGHSPVTPWLDFGLIRHRRAADRPHRVQFRGSHAALLEQLCRADETSELRVQAEVIRRPREQGCQHPPPPLSP